MRLLSLHSVELRLPPRCAGAASATAHVLFLTAGPQPTSLSWRPPADDSNSRNSLPPTCQRHRPNSLVQFRAACLTIFSVTSVTWFRRRGVARLTKRGECAVRGGGVIARRHCVTPVSHSLRPCIHRLRTAVDQHGVGTPHGALGVSPSFKVRSTDACWS